MSIFDKYNQQRKDGTYQAPKENVTRQSFEATIQRDAPELYNAVHQQRVINMWNNYVDEQQRRYEEALHEATHGRMNRSYLREDMLSGSYRNQQAMEAEEKRENAGKSAWESFIGMIGTGAAAQYAPANQKVDFLKQNEEYTKSFQQANKDLKATNNWAGRDALVREYNELQNRINADERRLERGGPGDAAQLKQNKQRLEEIRRELETKDAAAGNGARVYSTADRLDSVVGGAVKNIGGSLTSAAVTAADAVSRARENRKIMSDFLKNPETPVDPQQFRDVQSAAYRSEESQQKWDSVYQMAQTLSEDAAAELERAKGGLGFIGQAGVDIGENIIEMGFDAAVGALTGGSALVPMFARVFGQGAQEARNAGATLDQQIGYGLTSAMIEVATEKMFDGVARIYGAGAADEITERVIGRLAQSDTGRSFLRLIASGVGEGAEEVVSDLLSPLAEAIYKDQSVGELYRELNPADTIYNFLIGAAIGTLGGAVSFINGQNAAKNAELRDIDAQRAEQRAMRQAGYGTVSNQVDAAWDVLSGRVTPEQQQTRTAQAQETIGLTPEQARTVEQYQNAPQEVRQQAAASANTAALLTSTFTASGIELNETEQETLTRLAQEGEAGTKDTVLGMRDAYRLGQQGKTLEETTLAVEERGLTPTQISRAWGFGASVQTAESGTADVSTEEGKTRLQAALAALGQHTEAATKAYEARQDVGRYAAAMQKAAFLYAANGADLAQIVQDARDGKTADIVGYLTDEQVKLAKQIGQEQRQQVREAERAMSESRAALRQQAAAITAGQTVTAQALAETDTAIDVANRASQRAVNAINQTVERLEAMVKANPNAENTEAYRQAYDEAMQNKKKVEDLQKTVRELRRRKAEMEGKKTIKRKKGTISYAGGTVEGVKYEGVDPEKLTRQQKKVAAMVESLADAVNLDYVFISAEPGMGGAYVKGGTVFVNINAGMGVDGFSQTMAAASLSHELTHWMQDYAPEQYRELKDFIISEILKADPQELRRLVEQQRRWEQGRSLSYEQALDEVVANACQTMLLDSKAITKLARQNMSLAARIADFIEDWTNKIKDAFAEVDTSQGAIYDSLRAVEGSLEHIQELWDNGIEAAAANYNAEKTVQEARSEASTASNENAAQNIGGVQNQAIGITEGNKPFVDVEEDILAGVPESEWRKTVKDNLRTKFPDGIKLGKNQVKIDGASRKELTFSKYTKWLASNYPNIFGDKLRATNNVNEILQATQDWVNEEPLHPRTDNIRDFARGKVLLRIGGNGYSAEVIVATLDDGTMRLYDIVNLVPETIKEKETDTAPAVSPSPDSHRKAASLSKDSIADALKNSKPQFQMIGEVEATDKLVAVHNKSVSGLRRMLQRGGVPFPSIAIKKAGTSHEGFGDVSIVFPRATIDPAASRWNRLYSNDAWTPTEPRTEYEADEKITSKVKKAVEKLAGSTAYNALNGSSYLHSSQVERALLDSNGDVFNAFKSLSVVKYAYIKSKGQDVELPTREKPLDGSYRYKNSELKAVFDEIDGERLATAKWDDMELAGEIANILNRQYEQQLQNSTSRNRDKLLAAIRKNPLYSAGDINLSTIRYAYETYQRDGGKFVTEPDSRELDNVLRNNKAVESEPEYKAWIEHTFQGVVKNEGIPNGKDLYTDSGNMRSFKARHVPATLENIVQQMRKENERGNGLFGVNLRGAATKAYSSVEEMRQDAGKLLGTHVSDEVYDGIMEGFHNRLHEMASAATKYPDRMSSYDTARDVLLEAVRDAKSKAAMSRMLQKESDYIKYTPELADELWTLRNDVQNMPAPYFEAKPRRIVYPEEALAYILPDNADSDVMKALEDKGYNVLTYKAGDEQDRLQKLNSVEGAQFQRWDNTDGDTAAEANGREQAYAQIESENAVLKETVSALRKLTDKQSGTIAKLQKRLQITKTPEVREGDAKRMAGQLVREYGSRADREQIAGELKALGDYILQTDAAQLSEDEIKNRARQIAAEILDDAREQYAIEDENLAGIAKSIKGKKLTIDPAFLGELDQVGGFDALRKRNFGLFTLAKADSQSIDRSEYTSVSQFYSDLQSEYGKGYFPDLANEGEELLAIAENARAAAPMEINPFEQYMGEAVEHLSNQIAMDALGGVLRANPATDADRAKTRREALNEQIKQLKREQKIAEKDANELWQTVYDLSLQLDRAESKYKSLGEASKNRIAQVRAEGIARQVEIKSRERERAAKKIQKLKEHYAEMRQNARERREESAGVSKYRKQIEKKADKLYTMLMKNDDKLHVPEILKEPLGAFLESIDFTSKRALAGGEETQKDKSFGLRLQQLQQILSRQQDYINGGEMKQDLGGYIDVSPDNMEFLRNTAEMVTAAMNQGREFTVNQMSAAELKDLSNFLSNLTTAINGMNRFMANARFESVREAASQDIETIKELGRASEAESGKIFSAAVWENGTPYYVFRRFGEGGKAIFDSFTRGWEKMAFNVQKIMDFTKKTYSDKEVCEWQQERHEIELEDGSKVTMTTGQIMSFSMLLNREQARKHMEKGGVRIGDIEGKKGVVKDITHYHLTEADIQNILGQLTDRQAEVAQALQRFMAEQGAEWGNEISMRRFGYNFYSEGENYFPITTDSTDRPMSDTDAQQNSMFRLLNLSASKALNPKASNALVVNDIFDVFADHMADMAKLNGMGLPILDAIKWFNFKERIDLGDGQYDTRTMQAAIEQAFGDKALAYFRTLMKDINGVTESGDRGTGLLSKLMSNYKAASVAANLRVAFLQPTSYVRASYLIKPKFLLNAFTSHNAYKEAMEYSGTAVWKSLGYYDTNIARGMRDQIKHNESWKDKAVDKSMKLAEFGDQRTWGRLWVACKLQTAAETGLQGEELKQKTADLFREVIYSSQVMDATLTRSELMRGKTMYSKAMTAFMAEPTLSYNMVMDAGMEYYMNVRRHGKAQAWQESKNYLAKAFTVYACSATFSAIVESVFDALRDDDDMESFFEKWRQAMFGEGNVFGGNLVQDLTIFGKLPYVKSFMSTLQGYKNKDMSNAAFEDVLTAFKIWKETIDLATGKLEKPTKTTYYGNMTQWGKIYKSLQALSELSGLGVSNLTRDVLAVWNTAMDLTNHQELKVRTYESSSDRKRREAIAALTQQGIPRGLAQQAMQEPDENGDGSLRQDELGTWLTEKIQSGDITKDQADAIWETQGWKTEREKWADSQEKKEAKAQWQDVLDAANAAGDGKGNVTQEELASYLTGEISAGRLTEAEAEEAWKAAGPTWKKSYAEYSAGKKPTLEKIEASAPKLTQPAQQSNLSDFEGFKKSVSLYSDKKAAAYQGWENEVKPLGVSLDSYVGIINAADAAGDRNGSVKQDEMGAQLAQRISRKELSYEQAEAIWHTIWNGARSKSFYAWYNG